MKNIVEESKKISLRYSQEDDLDYVLQGEQHPENNPYVFQWSREQHRRAMEDKDIAHLIIEDVVKQKPVGYMIVAGFESIHKSIELRRIVITEKGNGFGREALKLVKRLAFEKYNAHRLWLDVRHHNLKAQGLYRSEGFVEEGMLREAVWIKGKYESVIIMSILEEEYFKNRVH